MDDSNNPVNDIRWNPVNDIRWQLRDILDTLWTKESPFGQVIQGDDEAIEAILALITSQVRAICEEVIGEFVYSSKSNDVLRNKLMIKQRQRLAELLAVSKGEK